MAGGVFLQQRTLPLTQGLQLLPPQPFPFRGRLQRRCRIGAGCRSRTPFHSPQAPLQLFHTLFPGRYPRFCPDLLNRLRGTGATQYGSHDTGDRFSNNTPQVPLPPIRKPLHAIHGPAPTPSIGPGPAVLAGRSPRCEERHMDVPIAEPRMQHPPDVRRVILEYPHAVPVAASKPPIAPGPAVLAGRSPRCEHPPDVRSRLTPPLRARGYAGRCGRR